MDNPIVDLDSVTVRVPPRFWWTKRLAVLAFAFAVFLVALRLAWGWYAHRSLIAGVAKYVAAGEPIRPEDFDSVPVPDDQNAASALKRVFESLNLTPEESELIDESISPVPTSSLDLEQLRRALSTHAEVLSLARVSRSRPSVDWGTRLRTPVFPNLDFENLTPARQAYKLLRAGVRVRFAEGDHRETVELLLDGLQVASTISKQPSLIAFLVSNAGDSLSSHAIEAIAPRLMVTGTGSGGGANRVTPAPREAVAGLIRRLLDLSDNRDDLVRALQAERMLQVDIARSLINGEYSVQSLDGRGLVKPTNTQRLLDLLILPVFETDTARCLDQTTELISLVRLGRLPLGARTVSAVEAPEPGMIDRLLFPLSSKFIGSLEHSLIIAYRTQAHRRMAGMALAIRLFELDHGRRPLKLSDLVPQYVASVPTDPLSREGAPIKYLPDAPRPVLYSVGDDGNDDGGAFGGRDDEFPTWGHLDFPFFLNGDRPFLQPGSDPADAAQEEDDSPAPGEEDAD